MNPATATDIAVLRFWAFAGLRNGKRALMPEKCERGEPALAVMDARLIDVPGANFALGHASIRR